MAEGSSDEDQEDKTYEPTPQKLEKAREKGDIAQSKELHALALYIGVLVVSFFAGSWSVQYIGEHLYLFFTNAPQLIVSENKRWFIHLNPHHAKFISHTTDIFTALFHRNKFCTE